MGDSYLGCGGVNSQWGDINFLKKMVLLSLKLLELGAGVTKGNLYIMWNVLGWTKKETL